MTQEEKAKAYDEALKRANGLSLHQPIKDVIEYIFPELAECDDEKIRKNLIAFFKSEYGENSNARFAGIKVKDIIAWLEKHNNNEFKLPSDFKEAVYKVANFINPYTNSSDFDEAVNSFAEQLLTLAKNEIPKFRIGDTVCMISEEMPYPITIEKIENGNYIYNNGKGFISIKFQDNYELIKQEPILNQSSAEKLMLNGNIKLRGVKKILLDLTKLYMRFISKGIAMLRTGSKISIHKKK